MSDIQITPEQREILEAGRNFAALETTIAYKALAKFIDGFAAQSREDALAALKDGATDTYVRLSIRRDAADELRADIQQWISDIKQQAVDLAEQLKEETE